MTITPSPKPIGPQRRETSAPSTLGRILGALILVGMTAVVLAGCAALTALLLRVIL